MLNSIEDFRQGVIKNGLLTADELRSFEVTFWRSARSDVKQYARSLVTAGKLTEYQAAHIYQEVQKPLVYGGYVVLERIGAGGMGIVYKAYHRNLDRYAAVKVLPSSAMKSKDAVQRFYQGAKAAARLTHPNIVVTYDANEEFGHHYLAMEYVEGQDLAALVRSQGPLPAASAVDYCLQAAQGLNYAHGLGVVHRDVKPSNLLLSPSGTLKILDMGLARLSDDQRVGPAATMEGLTQTGQIMGSVDFMSPEQALDTRSADERSDIYSLGCTLYWLLTGGPMYAADTLVKRLVQHREAPIPSLRGQRTGISEELEDAHQRMVAKTPADRPATMADVVMLLEACLKGNLVGAPTTAECPMPGPQTIAPSSKPDTSRMGECPLEAPSTTKLRHASAETMAPPQRPTPRKVAHAQTPVPGEDVRHESFAAGDGAPEAPPLVTGWSRALSWLVSKPALALGIVASVLILFLIVGGIGTAIVATFIDPDDPPGRATNSDEVVAESGPAAPPPTPEPSPAAPAPETPKAEPPFDISRCRASDFISDASVLSFQVHFPTPSERDTLGGLLGRELDPFDSFEIYVKDLQLGSGIDSLKDIAITDDGSPKGRVFAALLSREEWKQPVNNVVAAHQGVDMHFWPLQEVFFISHKRLVVFARSETALKAAIDAAVTRHDAPRFAEDAAVLDIRALDVPRALDSIRTNWDQEAQLAKFVETYGDNLDGVTGANFGLYLQGDQAVWLLQLDCDDDAAAEDTASRLRALGIAVQQNRDGRLKGGEIARGSNEERALSALVDAAVTQEKRQVRHQVIFLPSKVGAPNDRPSAKELSQYSAAHFLPTTTPILMHVQPASLLGNALMKEIPPDMKKGFDDAIAELSPGATTANVKEFAMALDGDEVVISASLFDRDWKPNSATELSPYRSYSIWKHKDGYFAYDRRLLVMSNSQRALKGALDQALDEEATAVNGQADLAFRVNDLSALDKLAQRSGVGESASQLPSGFDKIQAVYGAMDYEARRGVVIEMGLTLADIASSTRITEELNAVRDVLRSQLNQRIHDGTIERGSAGARLGTSLLAGDLDRRDNEVRYKATFDLGDLVGVAALTKAGGGIDPKPPQRPTMGEQEKKAAANLTRAIALFEKSEDNNDKEQRAKAITQLREIVKSYPDTNAAIEAKRILAKAGVPSN